MRTHHVEQCYDIITDVLQIVGQQKIIANTELNLSKDEADDRAPLID